ncbi:unnamed protein product [Boreogadus saida]
MLCDMSRSTRTGMLLHGVWEEWSPWSLCSFTCGRGHRTRTRMCAPPLHGGRACDGPETQSKLCNIALCPVDGQWQEWSTWSDCSVTCANGTQQRTRQCSAAAHGGSECRGHWAESRECYNPDCTAFHDKCDRFPHVLNIIANCLPGEAKVAMERASLWSSCVVLPLLALTWMSAVLAMTDKRSILFQILFAVFDSLQGLVIVMVHCILRREVQDAFRCRLRNCQDPMNADATGTFPNGHAQIMTDFEKDVDIACRSALHKDMGLCRAATITGTLSRISLNDEEEEEQQQKASEGLNYATLPGNINMSKVIIQPSALHMPMGVVGMAGGELGELGGGGGLGIGGVGGDMRRAVYLCTDDAMRHGEQDMSGRDMDGQMMETDYIVMPRAAGGGGGGGGGGAASVGNVPTLLKDDGCKMGMGMGGMETLSHDRLMHYKMSPDFGGMSAAAMEHLGLGLEQQQQQQQQYPGPPEHMQTLPFEPRTAVKNFLAEMEESGGLSRSETGSTISMSSLERRKSRYSDLDFEKVMHTRKRHMELFQELNQKFQTLDRFRDIPNMGSMRPLQTMDTKTMPNKNPWESYNPACEYQNYATMSVLEPGAKASLEMTAAEWEKCVNLPLEVQEGDFQTEV